MGKNRTGTFAHVFLHVSSVEKSAQFYDLVLRQLGWVRTMRDPEWAAWTHGNQAFFIVIVGEKYRAAGYHRKRIGMNHVAFHVESRDAVDSFAKHMEANAVPLLYEGPKEYPEYRVGYYAVYFEDPDRIKVEVAYIPTERHVDH